jgi:anti-sigma factor RsiW
MKCNYDKEQFFYLLSDQLEENRRSELEAHLATCPECQMEWEAAKKIWLLMEEVPSPEPSEAVRTGFSAILKNYKEEQATNNSPWLTLVRKLRDLWIVQPGMQMAYSAILLLAGLSIGYLFAHPMPTQTTATAATATAAAAPATAMAATSGQVDSLSAQIREMKQSMAISLLENPSASERIRAVSYTSEIGKANKQVVDALLETLNNDPNVNVRLVTLEALAKFAGQPAVRQGLVQSIANQESPLVQSAIADIMVKLQEKRSVRSLQELLQKKDLNEAIRNKIELSIRKLT